jgi:Bax protein
MPLVKILNFKTTALLTAILIQSPTNVGASWGLESLMDSFNSPNFNQIKDVKERKKAFFQYLLPEAIKQNAQITLLRQSIKTGSISQSKLEKTYKLYHVNNGDITELLSRVDTIPVSLVLAQGAYESNWGRSRFAENWNNFFGIWCFTEGCGVMPLNRNKNATHEVAKFSSLGDSMRTYMRSINRNSAYKMLREVRQNKRKQQLPITGVALAKGLENYSGIGYKYVETVRSIICYNKLEQCLDRPKTTKAKTVENNKDENKTETNKIENKLEKIELNKDKNKSKNINKPKDKLDKIEANKIEKTI